MRKIASMMAATATCRRRQEVYTMKVGRKETRVTVAAETRELNPGKARERERERERKRKRVHHMK